MALTLSEDNPKAAKFLSTHPVGVLATATKEGIAHAAVIYFVVDPNLTVYFMSKEETTKVHNILQNPAVALAVYEQETQKTVQLTGTAVLINDASRMNDIFRRILAVTRATSEGSAPPISKLAAGVYKVFAITPKTIRLAEFVKPEHGQFDDLFTTTTVPDGTLE